MTSRYTLDRDHEAFVQNQVATGRYADASAVVRDALRLLKDREHRLNHIDASIGRGLADVAAGRLNEADAVFDTLEAELAALPEPSSA